jgi:hypothetical protein
MGGQACVFYGGAEFSRDTDFAILADAENLKRMQRALHELDADLIAVPTLSLAHLHQGHAIHFRCKHPDADRMRVDVMSKMRGVDDFNELWQRRTTLQGADGTIYELMSLPDLVKAKKTQRDKDWPMIRRLIEADHIANESHPSPQQIHFWLKEARTPNLLIHLAKTYANEVPKILSERPAVLQSALEGNESEMEKAKKYKTIKIKKGTVLFRSMGAKDDIKSMFIGYQDVKNKDDNRNLTLHLDTGNETISAAQKVKDKIAAKSSVFGKFVTKKVAISLKTPTSCNAKTINKIPMKYKIELISTLVKA